MTSSALLRRIDDCPGQAGRPTADHWPTIGPVFGPLSALGNAKRAKNKAFGRSYSRKQTNGGGRAGGGGAPRFGGSEPWGAGPKPPPLPPAPPRGVPPPPVADVSA